MKHITEKVDGSDDIKTVIFYNQHLQICCTVCPQYFFSWVCWSAYNTSCLFLVIPIKFYPKPYLIFTLRPAVFSFIFLFLTGLETGGAIFMCVHYL